MRQLISSRRGDRVPAPLLQDCGDVDQTVLGQRARRVGDDAALRPSPLGPQPAFVLLAVRQALSPHQASELSQRCLAVTLCTLGCTSVELT